MLGWQICVYRRSASNQDEKILAARWKTGIFGIKWLDDLVKENRAEFTGGDGYPSYYKITSSLFKSVLEKGLPSHDTPPVIGEDYFLPAGWNGKLELNKQILSDCKPDEELIIEAWDQS